MFRRALVLTLACMTLAAAACAGDGGAQPSSPSPAADNLPGAPASLRAGDCACAGIGGAPSTALVAAASYQAASQSAVALGQEATAGGLVITVIGLTEGTAAEVGGRQPDGEGASWVVASVSVTNSAGSDRTFPQLSFACADGRAHSAIQAATAGAPDPAAFLRPGARVSGPLLLVRPGNCTAPFLIAESGGAVAAWRVS